MPRQNVSETEVAPDEVGVGARLPASVFRWQRVGEIVATALRDRILSGELAGRRALTQGRYAARDLSRKQTFAPRGPSYP